MSGLPYPENSIKSGSYRRVRPRLFTSVHGVSVVILWSAKSPLADGHPYGVGVWLRKLLFAH